AVACDDNGVALFDFVRHHRGHESIFLYRCRRAAVDKPAPMMALTTMDKLLFCLGIGAAQNAAGLPGRRYSACRVPSCRSVSSVGQSTMRLMRRARYDC